MADRGVSGPTLLDACQARGWTVVLRLNVGERQAHRLRVQCSPATADAVPTWDPDERLWDRIGSVSSGWHAAVQSCNGAGWRDGHLTVSQRPGLSERWVLFSTRPGGYARVREYARRGQVDATFADSRHRGWGLEQSHVRQEDHLERLLLVWHLALWWLHSLGPAAIKRGGCLHVDCPDRHDRRVVHLGWLWLQELLWRDRRPPVPFRRTPSG